MFVKFHENYKQDSSDAGNRDDKHEIILLTRTGGEGRVGLLGSLEVTVIMGDIEDVAIEVYPSGSNWQVFLFWSMAMVFWFDLSNHAV